MISKARQNAILSRMGKVFNTKNTSDFLYVFDRSKLDVCRKLPIGRNQIISV